MEDSHYNSLKTSLSFVPAKALNYSCRMILARNLDVKQLLSSKKGHPRDYRGFAELMGFQYNEIKKFETFDDPTMKILDAWETHPDALLDKLISFLEEMGRYDVIEELIPFLEKDAKAFEQSQSIQEIPIQVPEVTSGPMNWCIERDVLTRDDLRTGECTFYDAYVSYADEDCDFVKNLSDFLESPEVGLKLFIRGRDLLAGSPELDTNVELIKHRCRQMLIILTNNFIQSPQCAFQISFATSLSIEQRKRILVPLLISPCDTPAVLLGVSKIDFTKPDVYEWMWEKLIMSLLPQGKNLMFVQSLNRLPMQSHGSANSESVSSNDNSPVITYPETAKQLALPLSKTCATVATAEAPFSKVSVELLSPKVVNQISSTELSSEAPNKFCHSEGATEDPSVVCVKNSNKDPKIQSKSRSQMLKDTFRSYLRKGRSPSNSSSLSSGATSGFHSESTASDNFKCVNEDL